MFSLTHSDVAQRTQWSNWSGSVVAHPERILRPESPEQVAALLKEAAAAGRQVRVIGTGHSFTPLGQTDSWLLSLERLCGVREVDPDNLRASAWAGTPLWQLGQELAARGVAQANLGDIDAQTLAGALSTGTHGTGITLGILATQVHSLTLVTLDGEILRCSREEHADLFLAALVSLGTLGVIVEMTLNVQPAYRLHTQTSTLTWDECLGSLDELIAHNRHFEFFWFPYTGLVNIKTQNPTERPAALLSTNLQAKLLDNLLFLGLSELSYRLPAAIPSVNALSAVGMSKVDHIRHSHQAFATPRLVRFQEMEYSIPLEHLAPALEELRGSIARERFAVNFPAEMRFVQGDDIWLSPAHDRDSAYLAFHMYHKMQHAPYFAHIEAILRRYGGRPHWGKLHTLRSADLAPLYPRWEQFQSLRKQLDPAGLLLNPYLRGVMGAGG